MWYFLFTRITWQTEEKFGQVIQQGPGDVGTERRAEEGRDMKSLLECERIHWNNLECSIATRIMSTKTASQNDKNVPWNGNVHSLHFIVSLPLPTWQGLSVQPLGGTMLPQFWVVPPLGSPFFQSKNSTFWPELSSTQTPSCSMSVMGSQNLLQPAGKGSNLSGDFMNIFLMNQPATSSLACWLVRPGMRLSRYLGSHQSRKKWK